MVEINDSVLNLVERDFMTEIHSGISQIISRKFVYQAYLQGGSHWLGQI